MPVSDAVHELHHITIAERVEEARSAKDKRRGYGYAASVLRSHLGSAHGVRSISGPPQTLDALHSLHVQHHQADGHFPGCLAQRDAIGGHIRRCVLANNEGMPG